MNYWTLACCSLPELCQQDEEEEEQEEWEEKGKEEGINQQTVLDLIYFKGRKRSHVGILSLHKFLKVQKVIISQ